MNIKNFRGLGQTIKRFKSQIIMFIVISFFVAILSVQYFNQLSSTLNKESEQYLKEISTRISTNINQIIEYNYSILYAASRNLNLVMSQ